MYQLVRSINDKLHWLWDSLDVITGVIYMVLDGETTVADTAAYVRSHVAEAVRLHEASRHLGPSRARRRRRRRRRCRQRSHLRPCAMRPRV